MPDADPALDRLEASLGALRNRMAVNDPRKQQLKRLKLKLASKIGGTATDTQLAELAAANDDLDGLFGRGVFQDAIARCDEALGAIRGLDG